MFHLRESWRCNFYELNWADLICHGFVLKSCARETTQKFIITYSSRLISLSLVYGG